MSYFLHTPYDKKGSKDPAVSYRRGELRDYKNGRGKPYGLASVLSFIVPCDTNDGYKGGLCPSHPDPVFVPIFQVNGILPQT